MLGSCGGHTIAPRRNALAGFGSKAGKKYGIGLEEVGHADVVPATAAVDGVERWRGIAVGNTDGWLTEAVGDKPDAGSGRTP